MFANGKTPDTVHTARPHPDIPGTCRFFHNQSNYYA
jgi:hypothetical protein